MATTWEKDFQNPPSKFRGKPFWAWNGKLDTEELRRQIRIMHEMGLGGFFMHSRVGLDTAYLGEEWFECINACIDEAQKLDMEAWLYDEDRWPSGAAGGLVTKNPKYRAKHLSCEKFPTIAKAKWSKDTVAMYRAEIKDGNLISYSRIHKGGKSKLDQKEIVLRFNLVLAECTSWYNDYTYLDTLNHEAVQEFINVTHEAYRKKIGKHFGKTVPGIFTDEPNYGHDLLHKAGDFGQGYPWTQSLPGTFKNRYSYDLLDHLPELIMDLEGQAMSQARYHYMDCLTHLFVDSFARQTGDWCDKNNMLHTGHVLEEDSLSRQTSVVGNAMRFYEYMQAPGIDLLTEHRRIYDTAKQCSSVARQFGRKWRLTETYGCTGWDFPFKGHKALGDWQVALGINLRCQHLYWYTMEAEAKRDYPAAISYQSPWWQYYSKVEDYFGRVHAFLDNGEEVRDLLVIHPIESMWTIVKEGWTQSTETEKLNKTIQIIRDELLGANIDFDYGDEELLSRHGKVGKSKGEPQISLNKASYKSVLVPPMLTMRRSTLDILKRFKDAGGEVVFAGKPAKHVDALPSEDVVEFAKTCKQVPQKGEKIPQAVESARRISITDSKGKEIVPVLHLLREDRDAYYLFICNTGYTEEKFRKLEANTDEMVVTRTKGYDKIVISGFADCNGEPVEYDPDTAESFGTDAKKSAAGWKITTPLPALGSKLYRIAKNKSGKAPATRKELKTLRTSKLNKKQWDFRCNEPNVLVLDRPTAKIGSGKSTPPTEIIHLDDIVHEKLGIRPRGGQMVQPWARVRNLTPKSMPVALSYTFEVKKVPEGELFLAIERPETYNHITLNGKCLSIDSDAGWWVDKSLRRLPIDPAILHEGANEICMEIDYDENCRGFEICYLLGNFGARVKGTEMTVTAKADALRLGDWTKQGLPFYSGSVEYTQTIRPKLNKGEHLFVEIPEYDGVGVRIMVDGKEAGIIAWEPNELDITPFISGDKHELGIQIIGHRRNSHGPHHLKDPHPVWTGPGEYKIGETQSMDGYTLIPTGLTKAPVISIRK